MKCKKQASLLLFMLIGVFTYAQQIKVMTYNIRLDVASDGENAWGNRKDFLASQVLFYAPDIMGVQEAKPNQVEDLNTRLKDYAHIGIGREGEGKDEASSIFYKTDRFTVIKSSTFWLSETPEKVSKAWAAACVRICTYGLFQDRETGARFWVFNTHLDHESELARINGIRLILGKIKDLNTENLPVFFTGDFNDTPDSEAIINLKREMTDSKSISEEKPFGPSGTFNAFKHNEPVTFLIDYIFVSKNNKLSIKKHAVLSDSDNLRYPSDHLPVYIEAVLTR